MSVRTTSIAAKRICDLYGISAGYQRRVIFWLESSPHENRRHVARGTGIEISSVCSAVNYLVKIGAVNELPAEKCRITTFMAHPLILRGATSALAEPPPSPNQGSLFGE
jgi:hypothetical protein